MTALQFKALILAGVGSTGISLIELAHHDLVKEGGVFMAQANQLPKDDTAQVIIAIITLVSIIIETIRERRKERHERRKND